MKDATAGKESLREVPRRTNEWRYSVAASIVRNASVSVGGRLLYAILASYEGKNGEAAFPSVEQLARVLDKNPQTVRKWIKELSHAGLVEIERPRGNGQFQSNRYRVSKGIGSLREMPGKANQVQCPTADSAASAALSFFVPCSKKPSTVTPAVAVPATAGLDTNSSHSHHLPPKEKASSISAGETAVETPPLPPPATPVAESILSVGKEEKWKPSAIPAASLPGQPQASDAALAALLAKHASGTQPGLVRAHPTLEEVWRFTAPKGLSPVHAEAWYRNTLVRGFRDRNGDAIRHWQGAVEKYCMTCHKREGKGLPSRRVSGSSWHRGIPIMSPPGLPRFRPFTRRFWSGGKVTQPHRCARGCEGVGIVVSNKGLKTTVNVTGLPLTPVWGACSIPRNRLLRWCGKGGRFSRRNQSHPRARLGEFFGPKTQARYA